jgi:hypothetical protein
MKKGLTSNNGYKEVNPVPDSYGAGLPFLMPQRFPLEVNDFQRQKPIPIELSDLNGQGGNRGMPKNFHKKAGRIVPSFERYWTSDEFQVAVNEAADIE